MKNERDLARWAILLFLVLVAACGVPEPPEIITITKAPIFRPTSPEEVKSLEQSMAAVITVCSKDLGLPIVDPLYLHLYKNQDAFSAYLARVGVSFYDSKHTFAITMGNKIHINMEEMKKVPADLSHQLWGGFLGALAHEYAHAVKNTLAGNDAPRTQWISEGFADWVAAKVLDSLGWVDYAAFLHQTKQEILREKSSLPRLSDIEKFQGWDHHARRPKGLILTYRFAFLSVDTLVEKRGLQGLIDYLQSGTFRSTFGLSPGDFETEFEKSLMQTEPQARGEFKADQPDWKVGYRWSYSRRRYGTRDTLTRELIREDNFEGIPSFVMRAEKDEVFYAKNKLSVMAVMSGGKLISKIQPPSQRLSWPLEIGKEWRDSSTLHDVQRGLSYKEEFLRVASSFEKLKLAAGTFETVKIETYNFYNGILVSEVWYSPKVKWFVKIRRYRPFGLEDEELVSFKVD